VRGAENFPIPAEADDRLCDIAEPLFEMATVADRRQRGERCADRLIEAAYKIAGLCIDHDADDTALIAGLMAPKAIAHPNGPDLVMSSSGALALFQQDRRTRAEGLYTGNHAEQNSLTPCRGKPFDLFRDLKFESKKGNPG
jgi:hypothetical protein